MPNLVHVGGGWFEVAGERIRGRAAAESRVAELEGRGSSPNPDLATTTKKGLDEMTDAHRRWVERWEPYLASIGAGLGLAGPIDHCWAASPRSPGRAATRFYLAIKVGPRDYRVIEFDTATGDTVERVGPTASPKAILAEFRPYRVAARAERDAARSGETDAETAKPKRKRKSKVA